MGEERRSGVVQSSKVANPQAGMRNRTSTKPYVIAKRAVWEAYQQVKANRGAAGIEPMAAMRKSKSWIFSHDSLNALCPDGFPSSTAKATSECICARKDTPGLCAKLSPDAKLQPGVHGSSNLTPEPAVFQYGPSVHRMA
jgi:hypothetical protein